LIPATEDTGSIIVAADRSHPKTLGTVNNALPIRDRACLDHQSPIGQTILLTFWTKPYEVSVVR